MDRVARRIFIGRPARARPIHREHFPRLSASADDRREIVYYPPTTDDRSRREGDSKRERKEEDREKERKEEERKRERREKRFSFVDGPEAFIRYFAERCEMSRAPRQTSYRAAAKQSYRVNEEMRKRGSEGTARARGRGRRRGRSANGRDRRNGKNETHRGTL